MGFATGFDHGFGLIFYLLGFLSGLGIAVALIAIAVIVVVFVISWVMEYDPSLERRMQKSLNEILHGESSPTIAERASAELHKPFVPQPPPVQPFKWNELTLEDFDNPPATFDPKLLPADDRGLGPDDFERAGWPQTEPAKKLGDIKKVTENPVEIPYTLDEHGQFANLKLRFTLFEGEACCELIATPTVMSEMQGYVEDAEIALNQEVKRLNICIKTEILDADATSSFAFRTAIIGALQDAMRIWEAKPTSPFKFGGAEY